jgi:hypothetical protein
VKNKRKFDEKLFHSYFSEIRDSQNPLFNREAFLAQASRQTSFSEKNKTIYAGGMAASFGLLILLTLTLIYPEPENYLRNDWEKNLSQNVEIISTMIQKELNNE